MKKIARTMIVVFVIALITVFAAFSNATAENQKMIDINEIIRILTDSSPSKATVQSTFQSLAYTDSYEPNNDFDEAAYVGGWNYLILDPVTIESPQDYDVFKFYAIQGDRFAISLQNIPAGDDYDLYLFDASYTLLASSWRAGNTNEIVRYDVPTSGYYYVVVAPYIVISNGDSFYRLNFIDRIKSGTYTASLSPSSVSSPGSGYYSPIASVNLTNNLVIPEGAIVKRIEALGTVSPSLGNTYRQVGNAIEGLWHTSISGSGLFPTITISNQLLVKTTWYARYYSLAMSSSTWSSIQLKIDYEYDQTFDW